MYSIHEATANSELSRTRTWISETPKISLRCVGLTLTLRQVLPLISLGEVVLAEKGALLGIFSAYVFPACTDYLHA
jgi:hypothetical protein